MNLGNASGQLTSAFRPLVSNYLPSLAERLSDASADLAQAHGLLEESELPQEEKNLNEQLKEGLLHAAVAEARLKSLQDWLQTVEERLELAHRHPEDSPMIHQVLEEAQRDWNKKLKHKEPRSKQHAFVKMYNQTMKSVQAADAFMIPDEEADNEDDDISIAFAAAETFMCPLTRRPFEHPLTSSLCGHSFSREAVYALMRDSTGLVCPIPGCNKYLSKEDLKLDKALLKRMARHDFAVAVRELHETL